MIWLIIAFVVLIAGIVLAIINRKSADIDSFPFAVIGVVISFFICVGLFMFSPSVEYYTEVRYLDNPPVSTPLAAIPFETNIDPTVYVVKDKNSSGNSIYNYYTKTENGIEERCASTNWGAEVYIQYLDPGEEPYIEYLSVSKKRELVDKPSFWFNIVGWYKYKDFSIGEVCKTDDSEAEEAYVFHVPEGSLREIYQTSIQKEN